MKEFLSHWPYLAVGLAAVLGLLAAFIVPRIRFKHRLKKQGRAGEAKVAAILKAYARPRGYRVINDISIPLYDGTTQIDHILVGSFGLLLIETKSHKGDIYAEPRAKEWTHIVGGKREKMYNPLLQSKTHVDAVRYQLQKHNIYKIPVHAVVVFSGAHKTNLYIENGHPVLNVKQLGKYLKRDLFETDRGVDVQRLTAFFDEIAVTDPKILKKHDKEVAKKH